jgi:hypothetical protein
VRSFDARFRFEIVSLRAEDCGRFYFNPGMLSPAALEAAIRLLERSESHPGSRLN